MAMTEEVRASLGALSAEDAAEAFSILQNRVYPHNLFSRALVRQTMNDLGSSTSLVPRLSGSYSIHCKPDSRGDRIQVSISGQVMTALMMRDLALWATMVAVGMAGGDVDEAAETFEESFPLSE